MIDLPSDFDWRHWVRRWERMQSRYLVRREQRFDLIVALVRATQAQVRCVLDLGCGPGSTMAPVLEAFPEAQVVGIDLDPTMLCLAEPRLVAYGERARLIQADLRDPNWPRALPDAMDAAISATSLHWLAPRTLARVYEQLAGVLRPGGIFLNADHVGSESAAIQAAWERRRKEMRAEEGYGDADDWHGFFDAYGAALGVDIRHVQQGAVGDWDEGVENGMPLAWHLDRLRASGFVHVDCFWRCDCDAVYGGVRASDASP